MARLCLRETLMAIKAGDVAPDFELLSDEGHPVRLSGFRGRAVVLYFYPKDDTPGCTVQAQGFQQGLKAVEARDAVVLGVSPDGVESHRKFKEKYGLTFPLLADPDHVVAEAFGVWGKKKLYGREYEGVFRTTFLIGKDGRVAEVLENVKPEGHCDLVLSKL